MPFAAKLLCHSVIYDSDDGGYVLVIRLNAVNEKSVMSDSAGLMLAHKTADKA